MIYRFKVPKQIRLNFKIDTPKQFPISYYFFGFCDKLECDCAHPLGDRFEKDQNFWCPKLACYFAEFSCF